MLLLLLLIIPALPLSFSAAATRLVATPPPPALIPVPFIVRAASEFSRCCRSPVGDNMAPSSDSASVARMAVGTLSALPGRTEKWEPRALAESAMAVVAPGESAGK